MTVAYYLDAEVPAHGELDAVVESGGTFSQSADAAWPDRGSVGWNATGGTAYGRKNDTYDIDPGATLYVGFWYRINANPVANNCLAFMIVATAGGLVYVYPRTDGQHRFRFYDDAGILANTHRTPTAGRWTYIVIAVHRATSAIAADGWYKVYIDGVLQFTHSNVDNYDKAAQLASVRFGQYSTDATFDADFDEIKVATTYPEPYAPAPADDYLAAERTCVLYKPGTVNSVDFADYCVEQLGIPRANLVPLPNATTDEVLADYATFQSEVEDSIDDYFALNPTVASRCMCFLVGYGVPGYFTHGGVRHSTTSRLQHYGTAFSSATANTLSGAVPTGRLTQTTLAFAGLYLAARIDRNGLDDTKTVLDRGVAVTAQAELHDLDTLYSDDAAYRASLACQKLRTVRSEFSAGFYNAAFVFGDTGSPSFDYPRTVAAFVDTSDDSAALFRSGSDACLSAIGSGEFATALGSADTADSFDAEAFFEMLRLGGTYAEACLVATAKVDYTSVCYGDPLMTVAFQLGGYNVYRGEGGIESVDYETPVACARSGAGTIAVAQSLDADQPYMFAARAVSAAGQEERNTHVAACVEVDQQHQLLPAPLAKVTDLTVEPVGGDALLVAFSYIPPAGFASADGFDILTDGGAGQLDLGNPAATVDDVAPGQIEFQVPLDRPDSSLRLAVRGRSGQHAGPLGEVVLVPAPQAPAAAQLL